MRLAPPAALDHPATFSSRRRAGYPYRSIESALKLADRFIAGVSRQSPATADVTKASKAKNAEDAANPHYYEGPPRTAGQVAA